MNISKLSMLIEQLIHFLHVEEESYIKNSELKTLSPTQIHYIDLINHEDNPTPSELAKKLKVTKPSVTNNIDKLEQLKLTKKIESDNDRRIQHIHLTEKGKKIAKLHDKFHEVFTERLVSNLNKNEINSFESILGKALK